MLLKPLRQLRLWKLRQRPQFLERPLFLPHPQHPQLLKRRQRPRHLQRAMHALFARVCRAYRGENLGPRAARSPVPLPLLLLTMLQLLRPLLSRLLLLRLLLLRPLLLRFKLPRSKLLTPRLLKHLPLRVSNPLHLWRAIPRCDAGFRAHPGESRGQPRDSRRQRPVHLLPPQLLRQQHPHLRPQFLRPQARRPLHKLSPLHKLCRLRTPHQRRQLNRQSRPQHRHLHQRRRSQHQHPHRHQ